MTADVRGHLTAVFNDQIRATDLFAVDLPIADDDELVADLGMDSSTFALARVACQEEFGVSLELRDLVQCVTFGDVVALLTAALRDEPVTSR